MSIKPHEIALAQLVLASDGRVPFDHWDALTKQDLAVLEKWDYRGWWDCGVSARGGWVTEAGREELTKRAACGRKGSA